MSKVALTNLANLQNENTAVSAINANNAATTAAIDNTLSRDGTSPNQMEATLDMNSNHIINLPAPASSGEPVRESELTALETEINSEINTFENLVNSEVSAINVTANTALSTANQVAANDVVQDGTLSTLSTQTSTNTSQIQALLDHISGIANDFAFLASYANKASVESATIDPSVIYLRTAGYAAAGDGGAALYVSRGGTPVSHPGYIKTANNQYYEIVCNEVNVKTLGAKGDNLTDDTTAIQNARLVAQASGQPNVLYFPKGIYLVGADTALFFNTAGTYTMRGDGFSSVIKAKTSAALGSIIAAAFPIIIKDLCVDGNKVNGATSGTAVGSFAIFTATNDVIIDRVEVRNCRNIAIAPGELSAGVPASNVKITNCYIHDNEISGVYNVGSGGINYLVIDKCHFENNCITFTAMSDCGAINCAKPYYHRITNNTFVNNLNVNGGQVAVSDGVDGSGSLFGIISNNTVTQNNYTPAGGGTENTMGIEADASDMLIEGNNVSGGTGYAINCAGDTKHLNITGNTLSSKGGGGITLIYSGGVFGCTESRIHGNVIGAIQGHGAPGGSPAISLQVVGPTQVAITDNFISTQNQVPLAGAANAVLVAGNYGYSISNASYLN